MRNNDEKSQNEKSQNEISHVNSFSSTQIIVDFSIVSNSIGNPSANTIVNQI